MSSVVESEAFQQWASTLPEELRAEFQRHLDRQLPAPDLCRLQAWAEERMERVQSLTTFLDRFSALQDPTDSYWALYHAGLSDMLPTLVAESHDFYEAYEPESDARELCDWMKSKSSAQLLSMAIALLHVASEEPSREELESYEELHQMATILLWLLSTDSISGVSSGHCRHEVVPAAEELTVPCTTWTTTRVDEGCFWERGRDIHAIEQMEQPF
jgi:hypothetical protein